MYTAWVPADTLSGFACDTCHHVVMISSSSYLFSLHCRSGYCECENSTRTYGVGCLHGDFTCAAACETKPAWDRCAS